MASLHGLGLSREELDRLQLALASYVESRITHHVQEAANTAMSRMKERSIFCLLCSKPGSIAESLELAAGAASLRHLT